MQMFNLFFFGLDTLLSLLQFLTYIAYVDNLLGIAAQSGKSSYEVAFRFSDLYNYFPISVYLYI